MTERGIQNPFARILDSVDSYYSARLAEHGPTPRGADWNSSDSQRLRFTQLLRVVEGECEFSICDVGCGYGALIDELESRGAPFRYCGIDVSAAMVEAAQARYGDRANCRFTTDMTLLEPQDYTVASGIFNVKLNHSQESWERYVLSNLDRMADLSTKGFSFNALTSYSDTERMRRDLHYADPIALFDHCKRHYSKRVALFHDYPLYEFTMIVRK